MFASFTVEFQLGNFSDSAGNLLSNGSLGVLVADTDGSGVFGISGIIDDTTGLTVSPDLTGSILAEGNTLGAASVLILGILESNNITTGSDGGFSETLTLSYTGAFDQGDDLGFYWFPETNVTGSLVSEETEYGFFTSSEPDTGATNSFTDSLADAGAYKIHAFDTTLDGNAPDSSLLQAQFITSELLT